MHFKHVATAFVIIISSSSFLYAMNNNQDIELGIPVNDQIVINNGGVNISQRFTDLKEKISDFRISVGIKSIANTFAMCASYVCVIYGASNHSSPLLWTGYGMYLGSILINLSQNLASQSYQNELNTMIDDIKHSL